MEAFSLLNYWKTSGGGGVAFLPQSSDSSSSCRYSAGESTGTTTIVTSVTETEDEEADEDNDEGPFFDLQFALPAEEEEEEENEEDGGRRGGEGDSDCTDGGCELKFTLSSCSGGEDRVDPDSLDDVYFKETIVEEVEPPSSSEHQTCSVKAPAAQLSASILKSATKLRVFMLKMKKSKLIQAKPEASLGSEGLDSQNPPPPSSLSPESQQKSTVTVNLKVEEVPIISLFTRENSSKNSSSSSSSSFSSSSSLKKQNGNELAISDEKRFMMIQKYLKKVKPLYIKVSRRYNEKLRHSGQLSAPSSSRSTADKTESPATTKTNKPGNNINIKIPAGLKVVRKHLGKSRSSSSTATTPSSTAASVMTQSESRRRDDSLLQQQDSIQSAILHCKRSFNSTRDKDPSVLVPRPVSEPNSYEK